MYIRQWSRWDLLAAVLIALIIVVEMRLTITICQVDAETARVEEIMEAAQERIDAYYASLPAQERPTEVPAAPEAVPMEPVAVTAPAPEETPAVPEWYRDDVPLELELQGVLWDACREFEVSYPLALAVIEQETGFQNLRGDGGQSVGYFQVQPRWWGELLDSIGVDDLAEPEDNFRAGCAILAQLLDQYGGSVEDALTAYNTGRPGRSEYAWAVMRQMEAAE